MEEPDEKSFTVDMPQGWINSVYIHRVYELVKPVVTAATPDKVTLLFMGDARMPMYSYPNDLWGNTAALPSQNPLYEVATPQSATQYFTEYVRKKFGHNRSFNILSTGSNPDYARLSTERAARNGHHITSDAVKITLEYEEDGKKYQAIINGVCGYIQGVLWVPSVSGILSSADAAAFEPVLSHMELSSKENPHWKQQQQARHQQIMAKLRQDHANQLATYSAMNQAHHIRMQNMQAAFDAHNRNWASQQAALDNSHERFINYIRGEHTVVNSSGQTFKVDNSHQKYFVNTTDNTYIGTDATTSIHDLSRLAGVNPDDYEEVKIIR